MGIKNFTTTFSHSGVVTFKSLKNNTICIDSSIELYRTSLGMKSISSLTDSAGKSTIHINILLANIIKYHQYKIKQIWVFDHDSEADKSKEFHNPMKVKELEKRRCAKEKAKKAIQKIDEESELFSESECESDNEKEKEKKKEPTRESLEKRTFSLNKDVINDLKFMLNCLNIIWIDSPSGYESEQICACLTNQPNDFAYRADHALSQDADTIVFGAKSLIKKNIKDKKYYRYELDEILKKLPKNHQTIQDLQKIGVILGCDFAPKTPGIGAKTVLKKYQNIELTKEQLKAIEEFQKPCPDMNSIEFVNSDLVPFSDMSKINILIDWLENKSFSRARVKKQFSKIIPAFK